MGNATRNISGITHANKTKKYSIIIPGASAGKRMKLYGPKPLITIKNTTIIERQIQIINSLFPHNEIILIAGFKYQKFKSLKKRHKNLNVIINHEFEKTNIAYSIAKGIVQASTKNIIIMYGDLVFNPKMLQVPFGYNESIVLIDPSNTMAEHSIGCVVCQNNVTNLMYGLSNKWAQIVYLTNKELKLTKEIIIDFQPEDNTLFRWFGFELINEIISRGGNFRAFSPNGGHIVDVDSSHDLIKADKICEI